MSTMPTAPAVAVEPDPRSTFGWRAGSIRGILSLMVLGLLWSVALFSPEWKKDQQVPLIYIYLQFLLVLIIAYYFPPQGSIGAASRPDRRIIRLWPEVVPWVLVIGSIGLGVWVYQSRLEFDFPQRASFTLPLMLLGGFFIGHGLTWLMSRLSGGRLPAWFQDLQAWVAFLGMIGLLAELLIHLFILENLETGQRESIANALVQWEGILAGLVSFYFGARTETPRLVATNVSV